MSDSFVPMTGAGGAAAVQGQDMVAAAYASSGTGLAAKIRTYGPVFVVALAMIGLWYLMHYVVLSENRRFIMPPPHAVVDKAFMNGRARKELTTGFLNTGKVALLGFMFASILAFLVAVFMAFSRVIERAFFPYAVILQTIPVIALVPLFRVWFGPTVKTRVITCVLVAIFPIIVNFLFGLKSVDRGQLDLFTLHRATWWTRLWKLQLPSALPSIFTGLRIGAGLCVIGALVADFFFTRGDLGLGRLINNYALDLQYERLFGGVFMASMLGVAIYLLIGWIANRVLRNWHDSEASAA